MGASWEGFHMVLGRPKEKGNPRSNGKRSNANAELLVLGMQHN